MSDFEQCLNRLELGKFSVSRKPIINGGAIRPVGLLFQVGIHSSLFHLSYNVTNVMKTSYYKIAIKDIDECDILGNHRSPRQLEASITTPGKV